MTEPETTEPDATATEPQTTNPDALETAALERAESDAAAEAAAVAPPEPDALDGSTGIEDPLTTNDYTVAFSPRQVAVGLAIVAGLVAVVAARRRRGKRTDRND